MSLPFPLLELLLNLQRKITDWLLIGCCLQALVIYLSPFPVFYTLAPALALSLFKVLRTLAITFRLIENPHMHGIRIGRQTAIYPNADGSFDRKPGESIGGGKMCIMLLSAKCNQCVFLILRL